MTKQSRSENTRLHLVRSAAELFDRNGFSGTTLAEVSRAAGVTKGAFYFHFASKDELVGAIQAEACALLRTAVYRVAASRLPALQAVVDLTHELAGWLRDEPLVRASFRTARECGHRGAPFLDFYGEWQAALEALLRDANRRGELADDVDPEQALTLVLAVSAGLEMLWWSGIRRGSMTDSLTGLLSMVLPGLAAPGLARRLRADGS
ncbi:ScbR family autoregulator-binding transcription factor [Actinophytocola sp.]|uniref:ScbR family autoregulator-binding transcription factor n=1 Tax=Actinophytocola sp. TaxID=1872138 RepID=UPI00389AF352